MNQAIIVDRAEHLVQELCLIPSSRHDEAAYTDRLEMLFNLLFTDGGLSVLGHLSTLDSIEQLLRENGFGEGPYVEDLFQLQEYRNIMANAHAKLAAVLNPQLSIQDLLYVTLDEWPQLSHPLGLLFLGELMQELQMLRLSTEKPSKRLEHFFTRYFEVLAESEAGGSISLIKVPIDTALASYIVEEQQATVHALFAERAGNQGYCYRVWLNVSQGCGDVYTNSDVDEEMQKAARTGVQYALTYSRLPIDRYSVSWSINEPLSYEGRSIGLAIAIGTLSKLNDQAIDAYTAFTGTVSDDGHIGRIDHLADKIAAAQKAGFQRVILPRENWEEAESWATDTFSPIAVDSVNEAWHMLNIPTATLPPAVSLKGQVRHFSYECKRVGVQVSEEKRPNFLRLQVSDYTSEVLVDLYQGKAGIKPVFGGNKDTLLAKKVKPIVDAIFGTGSITPSQPKSKKLLLRDPDIRAKVSAALRSVSRFEEKTEANCDYRLDYFERGERVIVRQFTNGTLTIQQTAVSSDGDSLFTDLCRRVELTTGVVSQGSSLTSTTHEGGKGYQGTENSSDLDVVTSAAHTFETPWIGTDESGKGDYFGPLVSAAVYVDDQILERLAALGVKDSKLLSDKRARELAERIRIVCKDRFSEVVITPEQYNRLYEIFQNEGKTLNHLLAWGHYRALENLLSVVECENIIVDQFANEHYLRSRLFAKNPARKLNLTQMPRAEINLAVAAASILARDRFLTWLENMSMKYGPLPKGASAEVVQTARAIVARWSKDELRMIAKLHFKTSKQVLADS
jgi:ribonuclease HIII